MKVTQKFTIELPTGTRVSIAGLGDDADKTTSFELERPEAEELFTALAQLLFPGGALEPEPSAFGTRQWHPDDEEPDHGDPEQYADYGQATTADEVERKLAAQQVQAELSQRPPAPVTSRGSGIGQIAI